MAALASWKQRWTDFLFKLHSTSRNKSKRCFSLRERKQISGGGGAGAGGDVYYRLLKVAMYKETYGHFGFRAAGCFADSGGVFQ